jgi:hypothetical protein
MIFMRLWQYLPSEVGLYNRLTVISEFHVLEKASRAKETTPKEGPFPKEGLRKATGNHLVKMSFQEIMVSQNTNGPQYPLSGERVRRISRTVDIKDVSHGVEHGGGIEKESGGPLVVEKVDTKDLPSGRELKKKNDNINIWYMVSLHTCFCSTSRTNKVQH